MDGRGGGGAAMGSDGEQARLAFLASHVSVDACVFLPLSLSLVVLVPYAKSSIRLSYPCVEVLE